MSAVRLLLMLVCWSAALMGTGAAALDASASVRQPVALLQDRPVAEASRATTPVIVKATRQSCPRCPRVGASKSCSAVPCAAAGAVMLASTAHLALRLADRVAPTTLLLPESFNIGPDPPPPKA